MTHDPRATAVLGAIVADAAALGLHWNYDPERIAAVAQPRASAAFVPLDTAHYADVMGYFAHGNRATGQGSQYGDCLRLALRALRDGRFDVAAYQSEFEAYFGESYTGYVDRPTAGSLKNMSAGVTPSGIDDDQLPAIARLPAVVAYGTQDDIIPAIEVSNVNPVAARYGMVFAQLISDVIAGVALPDALRTAAAGQADLVAALDTQEPDSVAYGAITERACHLPMAMPLAFHIMARATDYADAVERNIRAGGDSCGRAMIIGAVIGAAHGIEGPGIPLAWILQSDAAAEVWQGCQVLASRGTA